MKEELTKDKIIKSALLKLGFPFADADDKEAEEREAASFLFDEALMELEKDDCFTFNLAKERGVLTDRRVHLGKFEYLKPKNYIMCVTPGVDEIGDKLYTAKSNFVFEYKEFIDLKDIPAKYGKLLALILAKNIAPTVNKKKALDLVYQEYINERESLLPTESFCINMEDLS